MKKLIWILILLALAGGGYWLYKTQFAAKPEDPIEALREKGQQVKENLKEQTKELIDKI